MKKIFITGATGFIGKSCLNILKNMDFEIHATYYTKPNHIDEKVTWYQADILDSTTTANILNKIHPHYLLHLAWFCEHKTFWSSEKNINYIKPSVDLYKNFSEAGGQKVIFLGSGAEYKETSLDREEDKTALEPNTLYGLAKRQTFELLTRVKEIHPHLAAFCWVRLFNIFGPSEHPDRLIPYIFNCYLQGIVPTLNNPYAICNYLYVDNLARILIALLTENFQGPINVGQGDHLSIGQLALKIRNRYFEHRDPPHYTDNKENANRYTPSLVKLKELNIASMLTMEEGLDDSFKWWTSREHNSIKN